MINTLTGGASDSGQKSMKPDIKKKGESRGHAGTDAPQHAFQSTGEIGAWLTLGNGVPETYDIWEAFTSKLGKKHHECGVRWNE